MSAELAEVEARLHTVIDLYNWHTAKLQTRIDELERENAELRAKVQK